MLIGGLGVAVAPGGVLDGVAYAPGSYDAEQQADAQYAATLATQDLSVPAYDVSLETYTIDQGGDSFNPATGVITSPALPAGVGPIGATPTPNAITNPVVSSTPTPAPVSVTPAAPVTQAHHQRHRWSPPQQRWDRGGRSQQVQTQQQPVTTFYNAAAPLPTGEHFYNAATPLGKLRMLRGLGLVALPSNNTVRPARFKGSIPKGQTFPGSTPQTYTPVAPTATVTGTTVSSTPTTAAPSTAEVSASVSNVASALGVDPSTITNDTTGFWNSFYSAMNQQSINPATASAATIQAAYASYAAGTSGSTVAGLSTTTWLVIGGGALLLYMMSSKH